MHQKGKRVISFVDDVLVFISPYIIKAIQTAVPTIKELFENYDAKTDLDAIDRDVEDLFEYVTKSDMLTDNEYLAKCILFIRNIMNRNNIYKINRKTPFANSILGLSEKNKKMFRIDKMYIVEYTDVESMPVGHHALKQFVEEFEKVSGIDTELIVLSDISELDSKFTECDLLVSNKKDMMYFVENKNININTKEFLLPNTKYNEFTEEEKLAIGASGASIRTFEL